MLLPGPLQAARVKLYARQQHIRSARSLWKYRYDEWVGRGVLLDRKDLA